MKNEEIIVKGISVDSNSRCMHYNLPVDIIAIKFKCCNEYYSCYECHQELADHKPMKWKRNEFETKAVLCGNCKNELTINEYMGSNSKCPHCGASFNPDCAKHYHLYFNLQVNIHRTG